MPDSILAGLNEEATQQQLMDQLTLLLSALLDRAPRIDLNRRQIVRIEAMDGGLTLATLTALSQMQNMGSLARPADAIPMHLSNIGAAHIYDNVKVS
jgi:hypothetical protein